MSASVSGQKTSSNDLSPTHIASKINTLWGTPVEQLKVSDLTFLVHCCQLKAGGEDPNSVLGTLFT